MIIMQTRSIQIDGPTSLDGVSLISNTIRIIFVFAVIKNRIEV